jgi:hypothetical protein
MFLSAKTVEHSTALDRTNRIEWNRSRFRDFRSCQICILTPRLDCLDNAATAISVRKAKRSPGHVINTRIIISPPQDGLPPP